MKDQHFQRSVLVEECDHEARMYRRWSPIDGALLEEREFTAAEHAEADVKVGRRRWWSRFVSD